MDGRAGLRGHARQGGRSMRRGAGTTCPAYRRCNGSTTLMIARHNALARLGGAGAVIAAVVVQRRVIVGKRRKRREYICANGGHARADYTLNAVTWKWVCCTSIAAFLTCRPNRGRLTVNGTGSLIAIPPSAGHAVWLNVRKNAGRMVWSGSSPAS